MNLNLRFYFAVIEVRILHIHSFNVCSSKADQHTYRVTIAQKGILKAHLISRWIEGEKFRMAVVLSGFEVKAVKVLRVPELEQVVKTRVRLKPPEVKIRGGESAACAVVIT